MSITGILGKNGSWTLVADKEGSLSGQMSHTDLVKAVGTKIFVVLPKKSAFEKRRMRIKKKQEKTKERLRQENETKVEHADKSAALMAAVLEEVPESKREKVKQLVDAAIKHQTEPYKKKFGDNTVVVVSTLEVLLSETVTEMHQKRRGELVPQKKATVATTRTQGATPPTTYGGLLVECNEVSQTQSTIVNDSDINKRV